MTYIDPSEALADVEHAIKRQEYEGGSESVCDILQAVAPASSEYWYEVACELHRRQKFYESLECWREAEKHLATSDEEPGYWYLDMIATLINAADQSGDLYFRHQALEACQRLITLDASEEALNYKLALISYLRPDRDEILSLIEEIFDSGFALKAEIRPWTLGVVNIDFIERYSDLAECYLWLDRPADAMRVWSKAIDKNKDEAKDLLSGAIFTLNWYADTRGFEDNSFLPEEFCRVAK
jgi:tetratricopeptide (TPR) repeat protein